MFLTIKKSIFLLSLSLPLLSCSKIDDYMLGKDNSPKPASLEPVVAKVQLKEKWALSLGSAKKNQSFAKLKPVIIGNTVYTADQSGAIWAISAKDGHKIWSEALPSKVISGPIGAANFLALGTDDSNLVILAQDTGKVVWKTRLSGDALARPLITKNKVIVKTIDGNVYAFDLSTGKPLWLSEHGAPSLILKASSSPVLLDSKTILVGYSDGKMDALDVDTGQVLWQKSIAFGSGASDVERLVDIDADPIVQKDLVLLAGFQGYVGALSLSQGHFIWQKPASTYTNMALDGNALVMADSLDTLWSFNKATGQLNWKQDKLKARALTEPAIVHDRIVVGDKTGLLHILSSKNGEFLERVQLDGALSAAPSIYGNKIYALTVHGKLYCYSIG